MTATSEPFAAMVTWHDAHAVSETWTDVDELDVDPCEVVSIGWLLPDAKPGHVVIAQSLIAANNHVDHCVAVPTGMVRRITRLTAGVAIPIEHV